MNVLAFNGSPRMKKGVTDSIVRTFLDGAESEGANTETVYVAKQKINYCVGCFNCWFKHPGKCIHDDDMPMIRNKIRDADIIVFGCPVYFDGFTAQMKTMLEPEKPEVVKAIRDAFYKTGVEAVTLGRISEELQDAVAAPLISFDEFVNRSNALFKKLIAENQE